MQTTPTAPADTPERPKLDLPKLEQTLRASLSPTYEVLRPLGMGGMGAVFLAKEPALKRLVAVKVLAPRLAADKRARIRFEREARAAAAVSHPNVVRVYAVGETKRTRLPYIIMQYVDGPNLEEWRLRRGRVSERDARRVVGEVAAALSAAHDRDLIHRDVKPSNVLVEKESGRAFVADFGVSAALSLEGTEETKLTETGALIGTPPFMSPEQSSGAPLTPKSDVYSLGVLAYQLLTGAYPLSANSTMGWAAAHLRDIPTPTADMRPEVSPAVAQMVDRCLDKSPAERPSAEEVARGMLPSLESQIEWPPPGLQWLHGRAPIVNRLGLGAAIGAILVTFAFTFVPEILIAHSSWLSRFQLVSQFAGPAVQLGQGLSNTAVLSMFVWQGTLVVGLAAFILGAIGFLGSAFRVLERILAQRRLGWRSGTLADVLTDYDGRSGLLISGTQDFASLSVRRRRRILMARRVFSLIVLAAVLWIAGAFSVHVALITAGLMYGDTGYSLFDSNDAVLILLPGAVLLCCAATVRFTERRLLGALGRPHSFEAEPDVVSNWYSSLPDGHQRSPAIPADHKIRNTVRSYRLVQVLISIAMIALVSELLIGGLAAFSAAKFTERHGPHTTALLSSLQHINEEDPIGAARSEWTRYLPPTASTPANGATDRFRSLILGGDDPRGLADFSVTPWLFFHDDQAFLSVFDRAERGAIPADTLAMLAVVASHPRTLQFRMLARATTIDFRDVLATDSAGENGRALLSPSSGRRLIEAARANALAAVLDVARQRPDSAIARLSENLALAEHLLHAPEMLMNQVALQLLSSQTLLPLSSLERARGRTELSARLGNAAQLIQIGSTFRGIAGLTVDPSDLDRFAAALANPRVPIGYRLRWLEDGWSGLCAHPREIVRGPSNQRSAALYDLAEAMEQPQYATEIVRRSESMWQHPATARLHPGESANLVTRLSEALLLGVFYRLVLCTGSDEL
ncbi:MAG: serine/threonine protein kinase [Gemmatimonadota bacterium]|nr:MAG: serine/threonine protein kinase [Gemmatimonadota bacterium]